MTPDLVFRDPYFLDFLGLSDTYSERDLEHPIIALDNVIREYRNYFQTEFRLKDPELWIYPIRIRILTPASARSPASARNTGRGFESPHWL